MKVQEGQKVVGVKLKTYGFLELNLKFAIFYVCVYFFVFFLISWHSSGKHVKMHEIINEKEIHGLFMFLIKEIYQI